MKRILLPLLLTLLFGCSNKNHILYLTCTLDFKANQESKVKGLWDRSYFKKPYAVFDIAINTKNKTGSFVHHYVSLQSSSKKMKVNNIWLLPDSIEFISYSKDDRVSDQKDWEVRKSFNINRINGEIFYSLELSKYKNVHLYKGECYDPENSENLF